MKLRKPISLLLTAAMLMGAATFAVNAANTDDEGVSASYYNQSYLETYASKAYNEVNLGSTYSADSTTWKTWSPEATSVKVKLYNTGSDNESGAGVVGEYAMTKDSNTGVWSTTLQGDFKNKYYTYIVNVKGSTNETQDIYSKATGVNGHRSMVVDLDSTDPDGWNTDKHVLFDNASQAVVWEVHVRDFSASATSGVGEENRGKYLAFTEGGTKLNSDTSSDAVSTGIDYLVEQGINCVQLMPVYDFESVDETRASSSSNRNWGYDPKNYDVPDGSYSSNAYDGNTRITEFKQMVQALHDRGISVVMDVVYNHTFSTGSCFEKTVPGYYYRMTSASSFSNGSGCGNETASDKLMYRKYMTESVKYWAEEYHIDGFRFDLMGLHDTTTMNTIRSALDSMYSDGSGQKILMYGEPWTGGSTPITNGCSQGRASSLNERVGMFCDTYRDGIKGGTNDASKGFIQGNNDKTGDVVNGVKGKCFGAKAPSQTIAYADAHDNLILWDKLVKSNGSTNWDSTDAALKGQANGVMALLLSSQGIPFMTAGSEFCRTKQGDHNSYKSSDSINEIDWSRVKTYSDVASYYKGLLAIRENYTPMRSKTFVTPSFQSSYGYVVAYTYSNNKSDEWGNVCVLVNSGTQAYSISLGASGWTVVANQSSAGLKSLGTVSGSSYSIPAHSAAVLVQSSTFSRLNVNTDNFGTLTVKHVDDKGNVLKTTSAKYRDGSTYRALPDSTIMFDHNLISTEGTTTGTVTGGKNYNVTFTYSSQVIESGYLTVKYVDSNGKSLKDDVIYHLKAGEAYDAAVSNIQGYQLDTEKFPANSKGTFTGSDTTITFTYKSLGYTTTKVHYYNSNGWSKVRCYAYTEDGAEPNGTWNRAPAMTSEGNNWYVNTVPASSAYVIFYYSSSQEPGQGEQGYPVSGEAWIQNKTVTFNSTVITSHIDIKTGKKIAQDVVDTKEKVTSSSSYRTSPVDGRTDFITPANATGSYQAGIINVVYLYNGSQITTDPTTGPTTEPTTTVVPTTTQPTTTEAPTTTQPSTEPSSSTEAKYFYGDLNLDKKITVTDATILQKYSAQSVSFSELQLILADVNDDGHVNIKDATTIQKYIALFNDAGRTGTPYYEVIETTVAPTTTQPETTQTTTAEIPTTTQAQTDPIELNGDYYLFGYINGVNYGCEEDYQTLGDYHFVNGQVTATFDQASYVAVKTADNKSWFMTDGFEGKVNSVTLYNTSSLGEDADKLMVPAGTATFTLAENSDGTLTLSYVSDGEFVDETTVPDTYSITFTNNKYWESVNCYYWATDDISLSTWPGEAMVHSTTNDYGEKIYTLDIPSTAEYMIFNDGGSNQTVDITITGSAKYYISGGSDKAYTVDTWE